MKKFIAIILLGFLFIPYSNTIKNDRQAYGEFLNQHPFNNHYLNPSDLKKIATKDRPDLAWEQDYIMTMDPALGRPTPERLKSVYDKIRQTTSSENKTTIPGNSSYPWVERGPNNVGGRTRAIMYDPNDPSKKKVWAGGVTGGLWYNDDITDPNSLWVSQNDFWDNISITGIVYDPTNTNVFYVGTGEGWGSSVSGGRGAGVWKSTDGGLSFTQLSSTSNFYFVNDLVVRDENGSGVLYVGLRGVYYVSTTHGTADEGLQRSTNGGTSFSQVLPNVSGQSFNYAVGDIDIGANNRLWVGTIYSGNGGFDRGGGRILSSDDGTNWTVEYSNPNGERVRLAAAPSDSNYVYAIIEESNAVGEIIRTTNHGASWSNLNEPNDADPGIQASDFSRGQAWVHLSLSVDPNNKNVVYAGSVDLFKTDDGGTTWDQLSHWYGGFNYPYVHADHHIVAFKPGSSTEALFGTDGGVARSTNLTGSNPSFVDRNEGYNITQFYAGAIHPDFGKNYFLAGSQDNGTHQFTGPGINSTSQVTGGDGAYCFIDQTNPNYQITSYVYNSYWRSTDGGQSFPSPRMQNDFNTGRFINPADYDDNLDILYSARNSSSINRISGVSTSPNVSDFTVSGLGSTASNLLVSPFTTSSTTLFVGTGNGNLFKITNANGNPSSNNIGSNQFPNGYISGIDLGSSEQEILVTFSNYGVSSVWYTSNGGTTWTNKEGNLPDMPVRWCLFNPLNPSEVLLATEVGVWATTDINASNVNWTPSGNGLANVRVNMLQYRATDHEVLAVTYGRGLFTSDGFTSSLAPITKFASSSSQVCFGDTVILSDSSSYHPSNWSWVINPNTVTYVNGTSSSSEIPELVFNASGSYDISLTSSNANGSDQDSLMVLVDILPVPTISRNLDSLYCNENGFNYQWYRSGVAIPGATNQYFIMLSNGDYTVEIDQASFCSSTSGILSFNSIGLAENPNVLNFDAYPIPVQKELNIRLELRSSMKTNYQIFNMAGQLVKQGFLGNGTSINGAINCSNLPSGSYTLRIMEGEIDLKRQRFSKL